MAGPAARAQAQPAIPPKDILTPAATLAEVGIMNPDALNEATSFLNRAITAGAFPGCRVLMAKEGKVFYDKSFGNFTYAPDQLVNSNTLYDIASITKIVSTTLAVMRLYEQGRLKLDDSIGAYVPFTIGTDKSALKVRDLLLHQAGLKSWIPFYRSFIDSTGALKEGVFAFKGDSIDYRYPVANKLFMRCDYVDTVWKVILESPLENKGRYVYSDLDYYFLEAAVENITGQRLDRYVHDSIWQPMGLRNIGYNPLGWAPISRIAPTEYDNIFRGQLVQGYVHDPGACLFGGVAGHAGVFATAQDVAAIFQMLLDGGHYNGQRFYKKETLDLFTAYGSKISRRGLGFDKPNPNSKSAGPTGERASGYTFGHQGFTGTCAWADPASGTVFVFLSNRVYPNAENNLINKLDVRTKVQDYLLQALGVPENKVREQIYKLQVK